MTPKDILSAMQWTGVSVVFRIGMVPNAQYIAFHGTIPRGIILVIIRLEAEYVFQVGTDQIAACIVKGEMTPRGTMSAIQTTGV